MLDSLELLDADLALVYTPLGASQWVSVRRFRRLPVSPVNPALVLCARRTATSKQHSQDDLNLDVDIRRLAAAAERSLLSLRAISARRAHFVADSVKNHFLWTPDGEGNVLTPWAMLIGIIYDPESIHFVAYIPCNGGTDHHPQSHYLSVHFESLPFPAHSSAEVDQQFLCDRYRVAIALLCLQQHAYRLTSLWEDVQQTKEEYEIYADHIRSLDEEGERGTPTPSELYSGEEPVSDDYLVIDYDEDVDGENPEVPYDLIEKWRDTIEDDIESDSGLGFDNDDSDTSHKGEDSTMVYV
ncbi:hypothetical protein CERSUDRAFT_86312 [Gelatoporia subvermispora B]|uniref:Uncharacterized protein n=1 Tax=Ceriporiopsis subvermispora (strain B) TaxID=914234 RepID=M2PFY8_CERS8|nr:hypothetical protein CERSUDRAFT_86312 [Gelatoporia subvermispora B]